MSKRMINLRVAFECERSCGAIIFPGDDYFFSADHHCICEECEKKE